MYCMAQRVYTNSSLQRTFPNKKKILFIASIVVFLMWYCDQEQCTLTCIVKKTDLALSINVPRIRANDGNTYY